MYEQSLYKILPDHIKESVIKKYNKSKIDTHGCQMHPNAHEMVPLIYYLLP